MGVCCGPPSSGTTDVGSSSSSSSCSINASICIGIYISFSIHTNTTTIIPEGRGGGFIVLVFFLLPPAEWNLCMFSHTAKHIIVSVPAFVLVPILFLILILTLLRSSREEGGFIVLVLFCVAFGGVESLYL